MGGELGGRAVAELVVSHAVDVDAHTGAPRLRVDVPCTPGRSGLAPALALTYSASPGNSSFGIGWSLAGWPAIGIDTRKRAPRWDGRDDLQLGGDEIVPLLDRGRGRLVASDSQRWAVGDRDLQLLDDILIQQGVDAFFRGSSNDRSASQDRVTAQFLSSMEHWTH
jgi:hypothetical protein